MKKTLLAIALASLGSVTLAQTAFSVNGQTVSAKTQKDLMGQIAARGVTDVKQQEALAKNLIIEQLVIAQEAKKQKIDQLPQVKEEIEALKQRVYVNQLSKKNLGDKEPTAAQITELYKKAQDAYDPHEVKISHILVKEESKARDLIKQIQGGADFAALAKENSLDAGTKEAGGALPMVNIRHFQIPGLGEAAASLTKGQLLTIPFKSTAGYHIVRLDDKREVPFPTEAELKPQLVNLWKQQAAQNYLVSLVKNAKIEQVKAKGK